VTVAGVSAIAPERIPDLLDSAVYVRRDLGRGPTGPLVFARWAAPDSRAESTSNGSPDAQPREELTSVWTTLRSAPSDADIVINPGVDGELTISAAEATVLLGGSRAEASTLPFRTRARLSQRWVLVHRTGELIAGVLPGPDGRSLVPAWFDEERANALLPEGAVVVQLRLLQLLQGIEDFDVVLDVGTPDELVIDRLLRRDLLATAQLFPRGYRTALGHLDPRANADFLEAAVQASGDAKAARLALSGLWVVGYRLEDAPSEIVYVADATDLDAVAAVVVSAVDRVVPPHTEWVETVLLSSLADDAQEYVRASPNYVGS
jgi:hypothetical protein